MENKNFDLQAYISKAVARLSVKKGRILIYRHLNPDGSERWLYTNGDIETMLDGKQLSIENIGHSITEAYIAQIYANEVEYTEEGYRRYKKPKKASSQPEECFLEEIGLTEELLQDLDELVA